MVSGSPDPGPVKDVQHPARPTPNTPVRRMALLIFLLSPLLVLAALVLLIYQAQRAGPKMNEPPKGAGAGETGMARPPIELGK
jgi:hypothetical protein